MWATAAKVRGPPVGNHCTIIRQEGFSSLAPAESLKSLPGRVFHPSKHRGNAHLNAGKSPLFPTTTRARVHLVYIAKPSPSPPLYTSLHAL